MGMYKETGCTVSCDCKMSVSHVPFLELSGVQYWPGGQGSQSVMFVLPVLVASVPFGQGVGM